MEYEKDKTNKKIKSKLLPLIIDRYTKEITGNFKTSHHSFARRAITSFLARLLNTARLRNPFGNLNLDTTIKIFGKKKKLRKLSKIGTIVMVPTHFSHLDSALIGWVISHLGLPAFMYGAGLVLYNMKIFAYFFNSLGAYKVDRRKKHILYLETLKTYTEQAIINDCHNLFYPGGTRSRSGSIEKNLKLGLLSSTINAQKELIKENKKIFIVPVTFSYQFVLEGPALINQYLSKNKIDDQHLKDLGYSNTYKILTFLVKYITQSNSIAVSFGNPMDVFGNKVNNNGEVKNMDKREFYLSSFGQDNNGEITDNNQLSFENSNKADILNNLSEKIISELMSGTVVFSSLLVAIVSFEIIQNRFKRMKITSLLSLPEDELIIKLKHFKKYYNRALNHIDKLSKNKLVKKSDELNLSLDDQIKLGCKNLGLYHAIKPVKLINESVVVKNMKMLYYYRNRLEGYGLKKKLL